jgi:Tfp pilus assembly protein PilX
MKTMQTKRSILSNEKGSIIVVAVIVMALLTILGISLSRTSTTEVMISNNTQRHQLVFYAADSGWKRGAIYLQNFGDTPPPYAGNSNDDSIVKNFGSNGFTPDNYNMDFPNGTQDGFLGNELGVNNNNIPYWYQIEHLPAETRVVPGSGKDYRLHIYRVRSVAARTQEIQVLLSKIYKGGYK